MNDRIRQLKDYIFGKQHQALRRQVDWNLAEKFMADGTSPVWRRALALGKVLTAEQPHFLPGEKIAFLRTVANLPTLFTDAERQTMRGKYSFSEQGLPFNFTPDYGSVIAQGLDSLRLTLVARKERAEQGNDAEGAEFLAAAIFSVEAVLNLADRYRAEADNQGLTEIAETLAVVPHQGATTLRQAMQFFRILHFTLWCEGEYHNGIGRLDQLLHPYYAHDLQAGILTRDSAFELLEEFFLTFNRDSDLYIGVQQGDNGQSLMIGGCRKDGGDAWNDLSQMILEAACDLKLIDPKINFRISADTPLDRLELGARLIRAGLGFPQYSNDEVMIPALLAWGYDLEDARDYTVAACWELVIPGVCHEFVNLDAISLPESLLEVLNVSRAQDFAEFKAEFGQCLRRKAEALLERYQNLNVLPAAFISVLCPCAIDKARNITQAGKYHNWGVHGTGMAVAADSLAALDDVVFQKHLCSLPEFAGIVHDNFQGHADILAEVRNCAPKLGCNQPAADQALQDVVKLWKDAWQGLKNSQGGLVRPGTGSAMYYIWHSQNLGATPDGRLQGEPFPANYAPSLAVKVAGPLSVIRSFTVPDLQGVCNGGPLTIELHNSVFSDPDAERKIAFLLSEFARRGGHQLQLNSIDRDTLLAAQRHPENYRNLIVRVWGWSGYFVELDKVYQDHIIRRAEMLLNG